MTTQTTPQKSSIKQRLRTDLGRSVGVTTATQLVLLTGLRAHLPTPRNSRNYKLHPCNQKGSITDASVWSILSDIHFSRDVLYILYFFDASALCFTMSAIELLGSKIKGIEV